jgi:hypothetical protein
MATIRKTMDLPTRAEPVWDVLRDFGGLLRLAPGFIAGCTLEEDGAVRLVTFGNGVQLRERLVTLDDEARRIVYTAFGGRTTHYNAAAQVVPLEAGRCRFEWTVDLLPDALAPAIAQMMGQGMESMRSALTPPAR